MRWAFVRATIWLEVRMMRRLHFTGLSVALLFLAVLLVLSARAGAAKPQTGMVKETEAPVWTLAMSGPRIAYAGGGRVRVWNVETGATSVVTGNYSNGNHTANAAELAIAGTRVAWIKRTELGNTEQPQRLYTARIGGPAHRLRAVLGSRDTDCGVGGSQIAGLVGSGNVMAVSSWKWDYDGIAVAHRRLSLVTATGLRTIATGPSAVGSAAASGGHIAVVPLRSASMGPDYCEVTPATTVAVYSVGGTLLHQVETGPVKEIALSGSRLVALFPSPAPALRVYDWTTGVLVRSWPIVGAATRGGQHQVGNVQAYGRFILYSVFARYVGGTETLHLLDTASGKDVTIATVKGFGDLRAWTIASRGLVYVVNHGHRPLGSLVFVPMANVLRLVSG
jgi:hypothetical protein